MGYEYKEIKSDLINLWLFIQGPLFLGAVLGSLSE
jgi:hypothetical protein